MQHTADWPAGKAFEYLVLRAFQLEGAEVRYPYRVYTQFAENENKGEQLEEIDGIVYSDGLSCMIECKDTADKTSIEPIAKLRNQLARRPNMMIGIVFSRNGFTESAKILTQYLAPQTILLWEGAEIHHVLQKGAGAMREGLLKKYRYRLEEAVGEYNLLLEDVK